MKRKDTSVGKLLQSSRWDNKLVVISENFNNVFFEVNGRNISINVTINGKVRTTPGSMVDVKTLANEILSVIEVWSM